MNIVLKIDTKHAVAFTDKLEQLSRSALPNAIRNTLNRAAFEVKQVTIPISTKKHFTIRKENFFKANSKVIMAKGYDINTLKATVGFTPTNAKYNNRSVEELFQQEFSGTISHRTYVPMRFSRSGGSLSGQVLPSNRVKNFGKIYKASENVKGRTNKQKFILSAIAAGRRGLVLGNAKNGREVLYRITSIRHQDGRTLVIKTPIYSHKSGRSVRINRTGFMKEASLASQRKLTKFYIAEAERQFKRFMK